MPAVIITLIPTLILPWRIDPSLLLRIRGPGFIISTLVDNIIVVYVLYPPISLLPPFMVGGAVDCHVGRIPFFSISSLSEPHTVRSNAANVEEKTSSVNVLQLPFSSQQTSKGGSNMEYVRIRVVIQGVQRVLKRNWIFISIAYGQPLFRRPLFNAHEFTWSIDYYTFGDGFHYFFYILRKIMESDSFHVPSLGSSVGLKPSLEYMSIELAGVDRPGLYRLLMFQAMHLVSQVWPGLRPRMVFCLAYEHKSAGLCSFDAIAPCVAAIHGVRRWLQWESQVKSIKEEEEKAAKLAAITETKEIKNNRDDGSPKVSLASGENGQWVNEEQECNHVDINLFDDVNKYKKKDWWNFSRM
ncbi:hypothetical protein Tco_0978446 [Tanacetum coccineum]|uniref:Uncharacterized protein n=1 Tax=Tanacetum coccineum TaxID=301880 RepID=A0ABQ5EN91_9ASTR